MAEIKITLKSKKTGYWYLIKLFAFMRSERLLKKMDGKTLVWLWMNGELINEIKYIHGEGANKHIICTKIEGREGTIKEYFHEN